MKTKLEQFRPKVRKTVIPDPGPCTYGKRTLFDVLGQDQLELPRPEKLADRELTAKLWQVIYVLLRRSIVLCNTDHLSDRELYTMLWNETLRKEFVISRHYPLFIDMTKIGVDEGLPIYLKYYASKEQRQMYSELYPEFKMPEIVEPPRRRDHLIRFIRRRSGKNR